MPRPIEKTSRVAIVLLLLLSSACALARDVAPEQSSPEASLLPQATISRATASPPATIAASRSTPTLTPEASFMSLAPPSGWVWYQAHPGVYRIAYPKNWTQRVDWDRSVPAGGTVDASAIQQRVTFQSTETGSEVIVDVWDISSQPDFDVLAWINANPAGLVFVKLTHPVLYNATILGLPAVFVYQPSTGASGDIATLVFTDGQRAIRVSFQSSAIPALDPEARVYMTMLENIDLSGRPSQTLTVPTAWEMGAGLVEQMSDQSQLATSLPESGTDRCGLTGTFAAWVDEQPYGGAFSLSGEDGKTYVIRLPTPDTIFRGQQIDYTTLITKPVSVGARAQVAGYVLSSGEILAEQVTILQGATWQTWFTKTFFDVAAGVAHPTWRLSQCHDQNVNVWLRGSLHDIASLAVDGAGLDLKSIDIKPYVNQESLAFGRPSPAGSGRIRVEALYVLTEACSTEGNWKHCPIDRQLIPAILPVTITATSFWVDATDKLIGLEKPVSGYVDVNLSRATVVDSENRGVADWTKLRPGTIITATGELGDSGTLMADLVWIGENNSP